MAGSLKPDNSLMRTGKEGKIVFEEYIMQSSYHGTPANLIDESMNETTFYNNGMLLLQDMYFTFIVSNESNIYSIGSAFYDNILDDYIGKGNVHLYKVNDVGQSFIGTFKINPEYGKWYILFENLKKGKYKVVGASSYSTFQEWFIEDVRKGNLYLDASNKIYGMGDEMFTKLSDNWSALTDEEKKALFEDTNYDTASVEDLATLGKFKVLNYSETNDKPELAVSAAPKDKLVLSREFTHIEDIEGIDKATLTKTLSGNGICKLLVTDDMKTYYTYDFDTKTWKVVDHTTLATVKTSGIDAAKFADIDRAAWDKLLKGKSGVGFAYLMAIEAVADQCAMDKLALQVDRKGTWA